MPWIVTHKLSWYHKLCINILKAGPIPKHIAIIMDGNRRYAKKENVEVADGHKRGFQKLSETLFWCRELGVTEVTVYAFSIENFKRHEDEVNTLIQLACDKLEELLEEADQLHSNGIRLRIIGNLSMIPERLRSSIAKAVLLTKDNEKGFINIAFAYTSRDEITNSFQMIGDGVRKHEIDVDDINEQLISKCMYSGQSSKPDILVRTSGEVRFSDFLLWQTWNTNVIFHKVLWPDFSIWHLLACIFYYQRHHAEQQRVSDKLRYDQEDEDSIGDVKGRRVMAFVQKVEAERMAQLEIYKSAQSCD